MYGLPIILLDNPQQDSQQIVIVQYQMEESCGECGNTYSKACGIKQHCIFHNQPCFACVLPKCKQPHVAREKVRCLVCVDECNIQDAYYDLGCENYLCRKEFQSLDFANDEVALPCGCLQLKEHVVAFMSAYCMGCLRKMAGVDTRNVRFCRPCLEKKQEKKEDKPISAFKSPGLNFFVKEPYQANKKFVYEKVNRPPLPNNTYTGLFGSNPLMKPSYRSEYSTAWTQPAKNNQKTIVAPLLLPSETSNLLAQGPKSDEKNGTETLPLSNTKEKTAIELLHLPSEQPVQKETTDKLVLDLLAKDLQQAQSQLNVSQFTRIELRKLLLVPERDKECSICIQLFTHNARRPMMICMQQHLICEPCFKEKLALANCPLCSEPIQRDKVRPSRERMRTLELENVMIEKYESKIKRYSTYSTKNITELRYKFQIKDAEVQTDPCTLPEAPVMHVMPVMPVKPEPKAKRAYARSAPKNGQKKIKKQ